MRTIHKATSLTLVGAAFGLLIQTSVLAAPTLLHGYSEYVLDGDTFNLFVDANTEYRVDLADIDAPEVPDGRPGQKYGRPAKLALEYLIEGLPVTVRVQGKTAEGVLVGTVITGSMNINHTLVLSGYAWADIENNTTDAITRAEQAARQEHRGLWMRRSPVPPWKFRQSGRNKRAEGNKRPSIATP